MNQTGSFFRYHFLRLCATGMDFYILLTMAALSILVYILFHEQTGWISLGIMMTVWWAWETSNDTTPGKRAAGLEQEVRDGPWKPWIVLLRFIIKWGQIAVLFWLSWEICQRSGLSRYDSLFGFPWPVLLLPGMFWLAMTLCMYLYDTDRELQDFICSTRVLSDQSKPLGRQVISLAGLGLVTSLVFGVTVIAFPNFPASRGGHERNSSVKANMHTLQTIVETYAVDWGGVYPPNVKALKYEATTPGRDYWKEFSNPFTGASGKGISYSDITGFKISGNEVISPRSDQAGLVLYAPVFGPDNAILHYYVYGLDHFGTTIQDKGKNFTLSNS